MKKTLVLFVTLFLVNLCISAQIQRKFFDFTLGETTRSEVEKYLHKKKVDIVDVKEDHIMVHNMRFSGQDWSTTAFVFYKGKLETVYFAFDDVMNTKESVDGLWKRLQKSLNDKYSEYYSVRASNEKKLYFQDSKTNLMLSYPSVDGVSAVTLIYVDNKMTNEKMAEEEDEL